MKSDFLKKYSLSSKTAIVTGAAGILGKRFCAGLASAGAHVVAVDQDPKVKSFSEMLQKKYDVPTLGVVCNVSDPVSVKAMVSTSVDKFKTIDILHNNAATKTNDLNAFFKPFEDYDLQTWREVMSVNLDGMFLVAQAVGNQMLKQSTGGSIVQTASIYGMLAPDDRIYEGSKYEGRPINSPAVYAASKSAVIGLTKYLAAHWGPKNIRVNALIPGGVESGQNEVFSNKYSNRVPMGRMAQADELVGALLYLASDASSYVTGQNLVVDGGWSAW